ncbi:MAG: tetratricopeptide repeat-containing glycosyltransferase family protein [Sulfuritalea sp.]|nr:tetratricopeptide repeat-containing glycosyltransferase family protein [Sulfuritalea sp.]
MSGQKKKLGRSANGSGVNPAHGNARRGQPAEFSAAKAPAVDTIGVKAAIASSIALYRKGQVRAALDVVVRGLAIDPENAVLLNHLGVFAARLGDAAAAEAAYRRAIAADPGCADNFYNLGNLLRAQKRPVEAESAYRSAVAARPDFADAYSNLGNLLREQNRLDEAEAAYRAAIDSKPDYADTYSNLGNLLREQKRPDEAEAAYRQAIAKRPGYAEAHSNLGVLLKEQKRTVEAEAAYRRATAVKPDYAEGFSNLGVLLMEQKRHDEAEAAFLRAIALRPGNADAYSNLGNLLQMLERPKEAEAAYRNALATKPDCADARWNLSLLLLKQGRFGEGWRQHEARFSPLRSNRKMTAPPMSSGGGAILRQWQGEPLSGRSLLVWPEQGLGDEIQFVRYLNLLRTRGLKHLMLACKPPLKNLFASQGLADRVISTSDWRPEMAAEFDFWCYPLSLPLHFATTLENLPATIPYLRAEPAAIRRWAPRLPPSAFRVGLVWKGSPTHANDANRSLPSLASLAPLWSVPGIAFVSLQKGAGEDEAAIDLAHQPLTHLGGDMNDFADSAAILDQLDLMICVDTAVAHLAGALGKPCWVLLPNYGTDWRWLEGRTDSPWYPQVMRLFRQSVDGNWDSVVSQLVAALKVVRR